MALLEWLALVSSLFPENFSSLFVERVDDPTVQRTIFGSIAIAVKTRTNEALGSLLTALVTKMRFPQTTGLSGPGRESVCAKNVLSCFRASTRQEGFDLRRCLKRVAHGMTANFLCRVSRVKVVAPLDVVVDCPDGFADNGAAGSQVLPSRIIWRILHSSETR